MDFIVFSDKDNELALHLIALAIVGQPIDIGSSVQLAGMKEPKLWRDILSDGKVVTEETPDGSYVVRMPVAQLRLNTDHVMGNKNFAAKFRKLLPEFPEPSLTTKPASASFELNGARMFALRGMVLPFLDNAKIRIDEAFLPGAKTIEHTEEALDTEFDQSWTSFVGQHVHPKLTLDTSRWASFKKKEKSAVGTNTEEVGRTIVLNKALDIGVNEQGPFLLAFHDGKMNGVADVRVFIKNKEGRCVSCLCACG